MGEGAMNIDRTYSWQDYQSWPEEKRWELIEGVPYDMSPSPSTEHQRILRKLAVLIDQYLDGKPCEVFFAPFDVKLSPDEEDHAPTVLQPDLVVVCDPEKLKKNGIQGAPDLVAEILSPWNAIRDRKVKFHLYSLKGVREYWIISPEDKTLEVYRQDSAGGMQRFAVWGREERFSPGIFPDLEIDLSRVF